MSTIDNSTDEHDRFRLGIPYTLNCPINELLLRFDEYDQPELKAREHTLEAYTSPEPHFGVYEQHRKFTVSTEFRVTGRRFLPDGSKVSETWSAFWRNGEAAGEHHFNNDGFTVTKPERLYEFCDMGEVGRWLL